MTCFEQLELSEQWRQVPGFEGFYEVSDWGRVRSVARQEWVPPNEQSLQGHLRFRPGRLLKQYLDRYGYLKVVLRKEDKPHYWTAHRLVTLAFIGPCPAGLQVDHRDGNRTNNHVKNLRYCTCKENMVTRQHGHNAKLSQTQVNEIRRLRTEGFKSSELQKQFGVSEFTMTKVFQGRYKTYR